MDTIPSPVQQKTIPTLYNMSSSQAHNCLWALEELSASHSIKYKVKNLPRRDPATAKTLGALFPVNKSPIVTLAPFSSSPESQTAASTIYQVVPGVLTESRLILQFFSDYYSAGQWVPASEEDKRRDVFFTEFGHVSLALKINYCIALEVIASFMPFGIRHLLLLLFSPIIKYFMKDQEMMYGVMEGALTDEKPWFSGERMGLADFNMSFPIDVAVQRGYFDGGRFPRCKEWHGRVVGREAYQRALKAGGEYDLKKFA
ncbi:putative glutathione S-transferase [Cadophora sp. MPI-SDFR-AT-0126]|nr:putative glutathione S-transferase [Leotiomycetes sp. MPI-SDFR-AT-0126]